MVSVLSFVAYFIVGLSPAEASNYVVSGRLDIPAINLSADVTSVEPKDSKLETPDEIVGSYSRHKNKTFLVGHSSTVFQDLNNLKIGDYLKYNDSIYVVKNTQTLQKSEISMNKILAEAEVDTVVIMTCAGQILSGGDATHRFIVTAEAL